MRSNSIVVFAILLVSQFCGTSLWFAGNAILPQLQSMNAWEANSLGYLTSSVQLGFIVGTLLVAVLGITDKVSPSKVFFVSSLLAAMSNVLVAAAISSFEVVLISRFMTGIFLAGIYPVGMKIAADWSEKGLGLWLGALVGALALGTAFPHALKVSSRTINPQQITWTVSLLSMMGGMLVILFIKDGPFRKPALAFQFGDITRIYRQSQIRNSAIGYFGHMWELYAFWAFAPVFIQIYNTANGEHLNVTFWTFMFIAFGCLGCLIGGILSKRLGSQRVAFIALLASGMCCAISPAVLSVSPSIFVAVLIFWGFMVIADSPQLSALVALHAPAAIKGSVITLTTCIGFAITIVSIQVLNLLQNIVPGNFLLVILSPGPLIGLYFLKKVK